MSFLRPMFLYCALLAIPIVGGLVILYTSKLKVLMKLYDDVYIKKLRLRTTMFLQIGFITLMVISISFAIAKPVRYKKHNTLAKNEEIQNNALYIMLDVSSSMYVRDVDNKTRMKKVFEFLDSYIKKGLHDYYGLIVYTDTPILISPLTNDVSFVLRALQSFVAMTHGYGTSDFAKTFQTLKENHHVFFSAVNNSMRRSLLFISDGESHTKVSRYLFQQFVEKEYHIIVASVGSVRGAVVPDARSFISHAKPRIMRRLSRYAQAMYVDINSYNIKQLVASVQNNAQTKIHDIAFIGYIIAFLCMSLYISTEKL